MICRAEKSVLALAGAVSVDLALVNGVPVLSHKARPMGTTQPVVVIAAPRTRESRHACGHKLPGCTAKLSYPSKLPYLHRLGRPVMTPSV